MSEQQKPKVDRRKGPRLTKEELRAEIEAELRAEIEADLRKSLLSELKAELKSELMSELNVPSQSAPLAKVLEQTVRVPKLEIGVEPEADGVTINFIEDGITAWGKTWFAGEEITVKKDSPEWEAETDRNGFAWFTLTETEQLDRFGKVRWRHGLWRGKGYDLDDPELSEQDRERLLTIQKERDERNRRHT